MADDLQLGKAGLTESFVDHANSLLDRRELIKIRFTDISGSDRKSFGVEISTALQAECVGVVGRTMLIYRERVDLEGSEADSSNHSE